MDIKSIVCRLVAPKYRIGLCVCLGSLGSEGVLCGVESLQAAGLAVLAVSFWQGVKYVYDQKPSPIDPAFKDEEVAFLAHALKNTEVQQRECLAIGYKFLHGIGTNRDFKQAFDHFYEGAVLGSAPCAVEVGSFYEQGRYKPQNMFLARYWFERAAMLGDAQAAYKLAHFYSTQTARCFKGRLAYFLNLACAQNVPGAIKLRTKLQAQNSKALAEPIAKDAKGQVPLNAIYDYAPRQELKSYIYKGGTCSPAVIRLALNELGFKPEDFKDYCFTEENLRPAYLKKMHVLHPDANGGDHSHAEEMERLRHAYRLLVKLGS